MARRTTWNRGGGEPERMLGKGFPCKVSRVLDSSTLNQVGLVENEEGGRHTSLCARIQILPPNYLNLLIYIYIRRFPVTDDYFHNSLSAHRLQLLRSYVKVRARDVCHMLYNMHICHYILYNIVLYIYVST